MYYNRDYQPAINGFRNTEVSTVASQNATTIHTSRHGLMTVTSGSDVTGGLGLNGHPSHHSGHPTHHHHHHHHSRNLHHNRHTPPSHHQHSIMQQPIHHQSIYDVWKYNFSEGMRTLRNLAKKYKYVALDTEFPGVVAKVSGEYANTFEQSYHNIKVNIDILKPIQIGFSFFNEAGERPEQISTVQFNLQWDVNLETYASDSISLLKDSGIDFDKLIKYGIDVNDFGEAFTTSGLALNDSIIWIAFHSAYDWAYMLKICTNWPEMPERWTDFLKKLTLFFPRIMDIKTLMNECKIPKGGLQELADQLKVMRVGAQHQAGSDARLTGETYFRFLNEYSDGKLDPNQMNFVYGLNYCPNGANNLWTPLNQTSPLPDGSDDSTSSSSSSDNSGRTSPNDDNQAKNGSGEVSNSIVNGSNS